MRRRAAWAMALALCLGGTAACGGDDGGDDTAADASTTTTTEATTTTESGDLAAQVDEFCAKAEEFQRLAQVAGATQNGGGSGAVGPVDPSTSEATSQRMSDLTGEIVGTMITLQGAVAQMVPSDAARFQECAAPFGGAPQVPVPE